MAPGSALIPRLMDLSPGTEALRYCFALPAQPESVAGARKLTRARLDAWKLDGDTYDAAILIVSELVTNAVVHTASARVVCELRCLGRRLRIAVQDQGHQPGGPRLRRAADDEHGRGLLLVDAMSSAWGSHDAGDASGRIVWAELPHGTEQPC
ncbi:ATP-binding protein [Streptomyces sp. NPDC079020]|uniref:ATP-binding protein n=1 Tax=unclassified Streptomyces TaxID=2593676 RepID=UPI00225A3EAE|nr:MULTISPECIES: ATP-binding protein [unclassified Streptomyces]MCX4965930.1 ATP-binding protein [Streptomyces sp. NBC_00654]MEE1742199.1 ATP-binding protein [Streptomyces sp. BE147]